MMNVESEALGALEVAGFFANGEIGPVGGRTFCHTFSTSVGLLRRRG
jgi:small ligand-binding sensory domain FIST